MRYRLEYILFIMISTAIRLLPRKPALALGRKLGGLARYLQPKRVRIADGNLKQAFPEMPEDERSALVKRVFADMGVGFIEMIRLDMFDGQADLEKYFTIEGEEYIREARSLGRGCILLTGHLGFWEAGGVVFPLLGIPTAIVAKPMKNPLVDSYFTRMREHYGGYIINSHKGARRIVKALQNNHMVGILMDQHISPAEAVRVPFFGRPAYTTPIIAQLAMKNQVPIVPAFCYRNPDDSYRIIISPFFFLEQQMTEENVIANTALLTRKIEDGIRVDAGQWFWVHRRWKFMNSLNDKK